MSTNSECLVFEFQAAEWYYLLEDYNAPKNAWDWMDNAECYGPFVSEDAALEHLDQNHANPGGYSTRKYDPNLPVNPKLAEHVEAAKKRTQRDRSPFSRSPWARF